MVASLVVLSLLFVAANVSIRTVHRDGVGCGSLLKQTDTEVFGPAGTNPRPCAGSHTRDLGLAFGFLAGTGLVTAAIVRSRPKGLRRAR